METVDASRNITNLAIQRGMYLNPLVTVEIESKAVNRVTVLGAVEEPGVHELPRGGSDLVSALAAAGGLNKEAGTEIEIIRHPRFQLAENSPAEGAADSSDVQLASYGQPVQQGAAPGRWIPAQTTRIDLKAGQSFAGIDYRLDDRDIIRVVPKENDMIHVAGLVYKPGQFELPTDQDLRLLDAIALAGGESSPVADKVFVIRHIQGQSQPLVIQASIKEAKRNGLENLRIAAGDTITIEHTPATAVVETLSKFFRLTFGVARSSAL